ncbi:non-ribosomal peptide synthetase [Ophiocordyceps sinensis CO18]|uniref:Non-ribosomal peptide synthetase n=1 Tax=Ophiocordyceps sinensis (strain Co18 / CGMCC 3.14243) TaxID=911162 RepID=T5A4G4_OPHSC|nr:non-ribosomal peptide synthetase [Ophiocordyceps sinensis CO18]
MGIRPQDVAEIYPCSPLQEGILLSSFKGAATYDTYSVYRCLPSESATSPLSPAQMEAAWRRVVPRHTILSTVFGMHPEGSGFLQIVLANPKIRVTQMTTTRLQSPATALCERERPAFLPSEPQHELTICVSETGEMACRLDVSHALIDAYSMSVLVQELTAAYDNCALPAAPAFGDMVRFIDSTPKTQRVAAWTSLLDGVQPCVVPVTQPPPGEAFRETHNDVSLPTNLVSSITDFCKDIGITRATFLQVAWSMALSQFTGMREVCFGYIASGRDAPVDKIEAMVLETASERSMQHLAMQHASLAEIQHRLGLSGQRLFNTSLSIREADKLKGPDARTFSFENDTGEDPHEYDLSLSANIDGNKMDIVMEFREPYINKQVAQEACTVISEAIEYLLDAGARSDGSETLFGGFFKRIGPLVGNGYLKEPEKTAAAFIQDPVWLRRGAPGTAAGRGGVVYRTGDLVQYKEDGTLLFIGRKDTQVKIRGQRVELGEVEHHVQQAVKAVEPAASVQIIAETMQPRGADGKLLVAFVALDNAKDLAAEEYDDAVRQLTTGLNDRLAETLPVFMLPSAYIPIQTVPMMTTGKADRRQLRAIGSALSAKDIAKLSRVDGDRRAPRTDTERAMQALWARVLNMEPESIGIDDSFFRIGGDSIGAMKLVGNARHEGLNLSVRDVFQNPILRDLASLDSLDASS